MAGWEKEHMPSIPGRGAERALRKKARPRGRVRTGMLRELAKWVGGCQDCWLTALLQLRTFVWKWSFREAHSSACMCAHRQVPARLGACH